MDNVGELGGWGSREEMEEETARQLHGTSRGSIACSA